MAFNNTKVSDGRKWEPRPIYLLTQNILSRRCKPNEKFQPIPATEDDIKKVMESMNERKNPISKFKSEQIIELDFGVNLNKKQRYNELLESSMKILQVQNDHQHSIDPFFKENVEPSTYFVEELGYIINNNFVEKYNIIEEEFSIINKSKPEILDFTTEEQKLIEDAFISKHHNQIVINKFNLLITVNDIQCLNGLKWLNDNIINFYMELIKARGETTKYPKTYTMNTFFYQKLNISGPQSLSRWTRKVDLFSYELLCIPIHLGMHWCMVVVDFVTKTIKYYDSMGKNNDECLEAVKNYLEFEHMDKKNTSLKTNFLLDSVRGIPQQMNGSDCGVFACTFAEFASRKATFTFSQHDMQYIRQKMVLEIIKGHLLHY